MILYETCLEERLGKAMMLSMLPSPALIDDSEQKRAGMVLDTFIQTQQRCIHRCNIPSSQSAKSENQKRPTPAPFPDARNAGPDAVPVTMRDCPKWHTRLPFRVSS